MNITFVHVTVFLLPPAKLRLFFDMTKFFAKKTTKTLFRVPLSPSTHYFSGFLGKPVPFSPT